MTDAAWMARALELAARARGRVSPNPMVGAVIVRDGALLAEGWHHAPGQAHGEVDALEKVGGHAPGATMYVNLEPCCHWGRTPPCTDAVLASGISRVVVAMVDPDGRVSGRGISILREHGIEVEVGLLQDEARSLNAPYLSAVERHRPWVQLKAAATLDGRIASDGGESRWITGPAAREVGHRLRDAADAVLVGSGTLLADDPALTTRIPGGRDALPVVLDGALRCPATARLLSAGRRPLLLASEDALASAEGAARASALNADVVAIPRVSDGRLSLPAALTELHRRGVQSLLVEGGARVHRAFLDAGLVDRIELFLAPRVLAGGPGWVAGPGYPLAGSPGFRLISVAPVGGDLHLSLEPGPCSAAS